MITRIRLQRHGCRHHVKWWIVVMAQKRPQNSIIIEHIGYWMPTRVRAHERCIVVNKHRIRYWLSIGASVSEGAERVLHKAGFVPKRPTPFGSKYTYAKPPPRVGMEKYRLFEDKNFGSTNYGGKQMFYLSKIQEEENLLKRKELLLKEAYSSIEKQRPESLEDVATTDIESDEYDVFQRKKNFEEISTRLENHMMSNIHLKGNDLAYNIYIRKLERLARGDMGIDVEGYKEQKKNVEQFKERYQSELRKGGFLDKESDFNLRGNNKKIPESYTGRYPSLYRHYESYEKYKLVYPSRSMEDYVNDVNHELSFEEFASIIKNKYLDMQRIYRLMRTDENLKIMDQPQNMEKMRKDFEEITKAHLLMKKHFSLVSMLEKVSEFLYYGNWRKIPLQNSYIPSRKPVIQPPKFSGTSHEDEKLGVIRYNPVRPVNPNQSFESPQWKSLNNRIDFPKKVYRRIGKYPAPGVKGRKFFSTFIQSKMLTSCNFDNFSRIGMMCSQPSLDRQMRII